MNFCPLSFISHLSTHSNTKKNPLLTNLGHACVMKMGCFEILYNTYYFFSEISYRVTAKSLAVLFFVVIYVMWLASSKINLAYMAYEIAGAVLSIHNSYSRDLHMSLEEVYATLSPFWN